MADSWGGIVGGALAGGAVSLFVAVAHDRARRWAVFLDAELARLDDLTDMAMGLAKVMSAGQTISAADVQAITERRVRLGRNLKRLLGQKDSYSTVSGALALFARHLAALEPNRADPVLPDLDAIDRDGQGLRSAIRSVARSDLYWRYFNNS